MRKSARRPSTVWLLGLAGQPAKRVRQAVGTLAEVRRIDPRDLPGQPEYDRAAPLAVFLDLAAWRALRDDAPAWLAGARRVLVLAEGEEGLHDEVLSQGFLACLTPPLGKARILSALEAARENESALEDISRLLGEAQRERDMLVQENGRLAFFQQLMARAMSSLELPAVLAGLREDLGLAFPVSEVLAVFWGASPECELFVAEGLSTQARSARTDYLLDLAARLRGQPSGQFRTHAVPGGDQAAPVAPGRALLVPLRHGEEAFGCLSVLIHRDLSRQEQETARQALQQLAPSLKNGLDYLLIKRRADRDGLTGLFNRRTLDARLDQELKRHMRHREGFALILADIDHFKKVNDVHGHLAGDAALRHAAQTMDAGLRTTDFLARYGGEEFAAILPHTGASQAWMLAERLRRRVGAHPLRYAGRTIALTVSMGLAAFVPGQAATPASLLAQADQALYASKHAGRNRVSIAPSREELREVYREGALQAG
ncbi:Response regulator PleD [Fundidesulfovibrio magnetotacticus]|uniref:diguanylate cyclase n=1 Tax=Fundidesulfovibrio magnetotacticus TaxID=2730080 RepID=A0A6V8LZS5_9BACT|nr:GGDEF domain-containing protein [Fundidesulfovibrio magnetotacticus]GFK95718.1 Response regulator PleD [Fundidesulfovibrio magnetotacticus]